MTIEEPISIQIAESVTNVNVTDSPNRVEVNEYAPNEVTIYVPGTAATATQLDLAIKATGIQVP